MRVFAFIIAGLLVSLHAPARADHAPVIVVPGKRGVPVPIHGVDASGAVVWGDWGLSRPGGQVTVEGPVGYVTPWWTGRYFPATGAPPRYGRLEVEPPLHGVLPQPAATFRRV